MSKPATTQAAALTTPDTKDKKRQAEKQQVEDSVNLFSSLSVFRMSPKLKQSKQVCRYMSYQHHIPYLAISRLP